MSRKRFNLLDDPPTASSSDEEVENSIEGEEDMAGNSSTEEENDESSKNLSSKNQEASLAATLEKSVSDSESASGEQTDSDSEPDRSNQVMSNPGSSVVKPVIGTKDSVVKNQDSKKVKSYEKSVAKRSSSEIDGAATSRDAKRVKRISGEGEKRSGGGEEMKKTYFQRVWSEDDEIAVLQGLIDYKTDTGVSPYDNTNGVYQLAKKSISFDVSKIQFMEKLRSLKKKYENNVGKAKKGEELTFAKSHDRKAFELSKFIWGADGMALESTVKSNGKSKKISKSKKVESVKQELVSSLTNGKNCEDEVIVNEREVSLPGTAEMDKFATSVLVKSVSRFGLDDLSAQQGWSRLAVEDKKRFEKQWKTLQLREFELYSRKSGFIHEVVSKMAETFQSNP